MIQETPESWLDIDAEELNVRIDEAVAAGLDWPNSPLMVTLRLFGGDEDARVIALEEEKNRGEGADAAAVVYIRDGFLDDSIRGDRHEVQYRRLSDGTWRVREARVAIRCRRGDKTEVYQAGPCP